MAAKSYCIFETSLGYCGVSWRLFGEANLPTLCFFQLPEVSVSETESRIAAYCGKQQAAEPPVEIRQIITRVCKHLAGQLQDFTDIHVDLSETGEFSQAVYHAARDIPAGQTRTYGEIAKAINRPTAARAVGQALGRNPIALIIPCHRVLANCGKSGGFSAYGGVCVKARLLTIEGVNTNW